MSIFGQQMSVELHLLVLDLGWICNDTLMCLEKPCFITVYWFSLVIVHAVAPDVISK